MPYDMFILYLHGTFLFPLQVKRFQSDLLKILKTQPNKQVLLSELPQAYEKALNRRFNIVDYGVSVDTKSWLTTTEGKRYIRTILLRE